MHPTMKDNLTAKYIISLRKSNNWQLPISKASLKYIEHDMNKLSAIHITYVHKYMDLTTRSLKCCNAIPCKYGDKKQTDSGYESMTSDVITIHWLYETAVTHNQCLNWCLQVTNTDTCDETFELPVAALTDTNILPPKQKIIQYSNTHRTTKVFVGCRHSVVHLIIHSVHYLHSKSILIVINTWNVSVFQCGKRTRHVLLCCS